MVFSPPDSISYVLDNCKMYRPYYPEDIHSIFQGADKDLAKFKYTLMGYVFCEIRSWDESNVIAKTAKEWLLQLPCIESVAKIITSIEAAIFKLKDDRLLQVNFWKLKPFELNAKGSAELQDLNLEELLKKPLTHIQCNCLLQLTLNYPESQKEILKQFPLGAESIIYTVDKRRHNPFALQQLQNSPDFYYPSLAPATIDFLMEEENNPSIWTLAICEQQKRGRYLNDYGVKKLALLGEKVTINSANFPHDMTLSSWENSPIKKAYGACPQENLFEFLSLLMENKSPWFVYILPRALEDHTFTDENLLFFANNSIEVGNIILAHRPSLICKLSEETKRKVVEILNPIALLLVIEEDIEIIANISFITAISALKICVDSKKDPNPKLISHILMEIPKYGIIPLHRLRIDVHGEKFNFYNEIIYLISKHKLLDLYTNEELAHGFTSEFPHDTLNKISEKIKEREFPVTVDELKLIYNFVTINTNEKRIRVRSAQDLKVELKKFRNNRPNSDKCSWEIINWLLLNKNASLDTIHRTKEILQRLIENDLIEKVNNQGDLQEAGKTGVIVWLASALMQADFPLIPEWAKRDFHSSIEFYVDILTYWVEKSSQSYVVGILTYSVEKSSIRARLPAICEALQLDVGQTKQFEMRYNIQTNRKYKKWLNTTHKDKTYLNNEFAAPGKAPANYEVVVDPVDLSNCSIKFSEEALISEKSYSKYPVVKRESNVLPPELFNEIFKYLTPYEIMPCAATCTELFLNICGEKSTPLWESKGLGSIGAIHGMHVFLRMKQAVHSSKFEGAMNLLVLAWPQNFLSAFTKIKLLSDGILVVKEASIKEISIPDFLHKDFELKSNLDNQFLQLCNQNPIHIIQNPFHIMRFLRQNPEYFKYVDWSLTDLRLPGNFGIPFEGLEPLCQSIMKTLVIKRVEEIKIREFLKSCIAEHPCFDFETHLTKAIYDQLK